MSRPADGLPLKLLVLFAILVLGSSGGLSPAQTRPVDPPNFRAPDRVHVIKKIQVNGADLIKMGSAPSTGRALGANPRPDSPAPLTLVGTDAPPPPTTSTPAPVGSILLAEPAPALVVDFPGIQDDGRAIPPDTMGAVGPDHVVSILNSGLAFFDKATGVMSFGPVPLDSFFSPLGGAAALPFDPRAVYDQYSGRFLLIADSEPRSSNSWVLLAVSSTSNPFDGFDMVAIDANVGNTQEWADFPGLGADPQAIYITNNMFTVGLIPAFSKAKLWVIEKSTLLAGTDVRVAEFSLVGEGGGWQPAHAFGSTDRNYILNEGWTDGSSGQQFFKLREITFGTNDTVLLKDLGFIRVNNYGIELGGAPQGGCETVEVDAGDNRILNVVLRNGKLWTTHDLDPSGTGELKREVGWYEIDPAAARLDSPFAGPIQQGRVSDPSLWYFFPSIAVNANESVALGFSGSDGATFVGGYYTMRVASDPAGAMQDVVLLKAGESSYIDEDSRGQNRWGDYSATVVDPRDDATFWTTQEYAAQEEAPFCPNANTGVWGTWWGSFRDGLCEDGDGDGYGSPGNPTCTGGFREDCNDADPAISPGSGDACGGADTDCDGLAGNVGGDADGSGRVDGGDLFEWARSLGTTLTADPATIFFQQYSATVDFDGDGDVDGVDLQFLVQEFGDDVCI